MEVDGDDEVLNLCNTSFKKESKAISRSSSKCHKVVLHRLRMGLEFILTVSLLSLLLSSFTGLPFLHSYTYYFTTSFLFSVLTQAFQRKYMFLLCNAILVFLVGLSGFWGPFSYSKIQRGWTEGDDVQGMIMIREDDDDEASVFQAAAPPVDPLYQQEAAIAGAHSSVGSPYSMILSMMEGQEKKLLIAQEEEKEGEEDEEEGKLDQVVRGDYWIEDEEGDEEEMVSGSMVVGAEGFENDKENDETESEGPASMNTEELNRKIEEFIRKMKEELCLEAQQQYHLITF